MNSSRPRGSELFWRKKNRTEYGNKKKKKANTGEAMETSCGNRQISGATGVIPAPRVGYIDEEIHNAERLEKLKKKKQNEMGPRIKSKKNQYRGSRQDTKGLETENWFTLNR